MSKGSLTLDASRCVACGDAEQRLAASCVVFAVTIRYDMIRYDVFTCAQKLTKGQLSLAHGTETKN